MPAPRAAAFALCAAGTARAPHGRPAALARPRVVLIGPARMEELVKRTCTLLLLLSLVPALGSWGQGLPGQALSGDEPRGRELPSLQLMSLSGDPFSLPAAALGRVTVLVIGFSRAAGKESGPWVDRLNAEAGAEPGVAIRSVAVLAGVPALFQSMVRGIVERGTPRRQWPSFLVTFTDGAEWKRIVGFERPDDSYLIVIDARGEVVMRLHGAVSESGLDRVVREVARLERAGSS